MADSRRPGPRARPRVKRRPRGPGQRAGVTREAVLRQALLVVDAGGLDRLTMRELAASLGIAPNALYTYFPHKTALLDALADTLLVGVTAPPAPRKRWQDELAGLMRASRRALLAHPALVPLVIARPGGAQALRLGETALASLARGRVTGRRAVEALRALLVYTLGFTAVEVARIDDPDRGKRLEHAKDRIRALPEGAFPQTRAVESHLARHPGDRDFEVGLSWLLDGIASSASR